MILTWYAFRFLYTIYTGAWDPGGPGGAGPPLESRIYRVKFLKIIKISFFLLVGPPLSKNRSLAPGNHTNFQFSLYL